MLFRFHPLRFTFVAREPIHFPEGKSSNILRGAFGTIFRRIACVPQCTAARSCEWRATCPYARLFEPSAIEAGPSGLADWPRPFVFRAAHLDGLTFAPDAVFHFDLNLFEAETTAIAYLVLAFAQLAREGLGPGRKRVALTDVSQLEESGNPVQVLYTNDALTAQQKIVPLKLTTDPPAEPVSRLRVHFLTPTELKSGHQLATKPEFAILAARIRDRISTLRELYGSGPLDIDFRAFGERAASIRMTRCEVRDIDVTRRSSRTGQVHSLGGFIGEADYEGDLSEFLPYLRIAQWTGVGRQTVWGKGAVRVDTNSSIPFSNCRKAPDSSGTFLLH